MDPGSGAIRHLFKDGWVSKVSDGYAWVMANDQDPHPTSNYPPAEVGPPNPPVVNLLLRRDLSSGASQTWLHRPGFNVSVLGTFGPQLLVWVNKPDSTTFIEEYLLVSGPNSTQTIPFAGDPLKGPWQMTSSAGLGFADQHGIWLGGDATYLYTAQSGLRKVAAVAGYPGNSCA